jgi:DeoR/GlpR family transcriptional regulator of sugar metabolism
MRRAGRKRRHEIVLERLQSDVTVRISDLAEEFNVTTETIRRDLDALAQQNLVSRTYGGAAMRSINTEPGLRVRTRALVDERRLIARAAVGLVAAGDVLMIDAGSTTVHFAEELAGFAGELTIITNCLLVARKLGLSDRFTVIVCPGQLRATEDAVYGYETLDFLSRFHASKAIIGASGISATDVTDVDLRACWVKRRMIERSGETVLLADATKFDQRLFRTVCGPREIDTLVCDRAPAGALAEALAAAGVAVHVAVDPFAADAG